MTETASVDQVAPTVLTDNAVEDKVAETVATPDAGTQPEMPEWLKDFGEVESDLLTDPSLKAISAAKDPRQALLKGYVHAQRMVGADKVVVPGKYATPEEWNNFFRKAGLPEKAEDYELKVEGVEDVDQDFLASFRDVAHTHGILPQQAQHMLDWYNNYVTSAMEQQAEQALEAEKKALSALEQEWGAAYPTKIQAAQEAVNHFGDDGIKQYLEESGLGNDPNIIKLFAHIGEGMLTEDTFKGEAVSSFRSTPDQSKEQITQIMADREHPYHDKAHPGHKAAVSEMEQHFKNAYSS